MRFPARGAGAWRWEGVWASYAPWETPLKALRAARSFRPPGLASDEESLKKPGSVPQGGAPQPFPENPHGNTIKPLFQLTANAADPHGRAATLHLSQRRAFVKGQFLLMPKGNGPGPARRARRRPPSTFFAAGYGARCHFRRGAPDFSWEET